MTPPIDPRAPSPAEDGPPGRGLQPLVSLRDHRVLAVACLVIGVVVSLPIAWWKGSPRYLAEAAIHVAPRFARNLQSDQELQIDSDTQYRSFVQQQVATITRFDVIEAALVRLGPDRSLWQRDAESDQRAVERLAAALEVRAIPDTYLVTIGLEGDRADGLAKVVNAVADAYLARAREEVLPGREQRLETLRSHRIELEAALAAQVERATGIATELGVASFNPDLPNPFDKALAEANEALLRARRERVQAEAKLAALDEAQSRERAIDVGAAADELVAGDVSLTDLKRLLGQRRTELLVLSSGLAESHAGRRAAEREISEIDSRLAAAERARREEIRRVLVERREQRAREEHSRAVATVDEARRSERGLESEIERLDAELATFTSRYAEGLTLDAQIQASREQIRSVDGRIEALELEADAPGFAWLASAARTPEIPIQGGRKKILAILLVLCVGAALSVPIAIDLLDSRIHAPNDAERALGFPPLGWVVAREAVALEPFAADQRRRAALALLRERERSGARLFAFVGIRPGAGTSTLVLELANELAGLGVRTLAVEANALRPDPRFAAGPGAPGLEAVLTGRLAATDAIVHGAGPDPSRIPVGETRGVRHLGGLTRLPEALVPLHEKFDLVLVDGPPLGVSADAELLASLADVVVLVIEAEVVLHAELVRARRLLDRIGPRCAGAIVNRVRVYEGGGYFADLVAELAAGARELPDRWWRRWRSG